MITDVSFLAKAVFVQLWKAAIIKNFQLQLRKANEFWSLFKKGQTRQRFLQQQYLLSSNANILFHQHSILSLNKKRRLRKLWYLNSETNKQTTTKTKNLPIVPYNS